MQYVFKVFLVVGMGIGAMCRPAVRDIGIFVTGSSSMRVSCGLVFYAGLVGNGNSGRNRIGLGLCGNGGNGIGVLFCIATQIDFLVRSIGFPSCYMLGWIVQLRIILDFVRRLTMP